MRPSVTLEVIGLDSDLPVAEEEAQKLIAETCAKYTAEELRQLYESRGLVGDILLTPEEYDASEQASLLCRHCCDVDLIRKSGQNHQCFAFIAIRVNRRFDLLGIQSSASSEADLQAPRRSTRLGIYTGDCRARRRAALD